MILAAAVVLVVGAVAKAASEIIKQLQEVKRGNEEIHGLVNSAASKTAEKVAALEATISGMHTAMAALQQLRVTDAQQAPAIDRQTAAPATPVVATQVVEHQVVDKQSIKKDSE